MSSTGSRIVAILGPTNTGKTHLAMERLLGHASGMIGFPLRLLARENYERAVAQKGAGQVALITGEEKIQPPHARYFLCTVESMPLERRVDFLAIDEIQMCADPDRGHIFTDRLLRARGDVETMVMGAETMRPMLRRLVPEATFITRPRFSTLSHAGTSKLSRLKPHSAIVAFSVADVYTIAELIRRQRGGTAIVLGALSPRTRNAQVAMYQAGEVDYLVATDAIGMGLNMHVDHVAFAQTRKFDGRVPRALTAAELAQIAGRAGRYTKDGTFGTVAEIGRLDDERAARIENHDFPAISRLFWRSSDLAFGSVAKLRQSLAAPPPHAGLVRAREADDELALAELLRDPEIVHLAEGREAVERLWQVCQVPDFGKIMSEGHARLLGSIYRSLMGQGTRHGRLPDDWVAAQVARLDRTEGGIETLTQRIAGIRTWTYIAHQSNWLGNGEMWQERTRTIEDKLSDALHERLTHRFVDKRTASLVGRLHERETLIAAVTRTGTVLVEGHYVGELKAFRFVADAVVETRDGAGRAVIAAAHRALQQEISRRIVRLEADDAAAFGLSNTGVLTWHGERVARLAGSAKVLRPNIEVDASTLLESPQRDRIRRRLAAWLDGHIRQALASLIRMQETNGSGAARGLAFQLVEALGTLPHDQVAPQITALTPHDHKVLAAIGLRIGREAVYLPRMLKPAAVTLRGLLWALHHGRPVGTLEGAGAPSLGIAGTEAEAMLIALGYRRLGGRLIRVDMVERLVTQAERMSRTAPFKPGPPLAQLIGCPVPALAPILADLGFRIEHGTEGVQVHPMPRRRVKPRRPATRPGHLRPADAASPFAPLKVLRFPS